MSKTKVLCLFILTVFDLGSHALIQSPPRIVKQPPTSEQLFQVVQKSTEADKPFLIECEAEGEPAPKYRWVKNGKHFDWQAYDDRISQQPGRGSLVVSSPREEDLGQYQCFAENEWGTATSNSVFVRRAELNSFKEQPAQTVTVKEGSPLKLTCQPPDGWPRPTVYWLIQSPDYIMKSINNSRMTLDPEGNLWFSNVTRQDQSNDFFYTCAAMSTFLNEYKLGNRVVLKVVTTGVSASQNKYPPEQQYVSRKKEVALRGEKIELFCIFGGTPLPQTVWTKNGQTIRSSASITQGNYGKSLIIKHPTFEDEGTYTCEASNGVGSAKSYSIDLEVRAVPYFTVEPEFVTAAEDEEIEIRCEASGVPTPEIRWIHNGLPITDAPPNSRRTVNSNSIVITKLLKKDTGNYGCNATNALGYVYKDVYVNVLALAPEITEPPTDMRTVDGQSISLTCKVFGSPKPQVKWLQGPMELTGGRFSVDESGNLNIQDVTFADANTYTCYAINKFGNTSANGTLIVKEHTKITDEPEDYEVAAGSQATFRCNAVSDPSLDLQINWLNNDVEINYEDEPRFLKTNDYSLTITQTTELDSGVYTCVASTELDRVTAQATLTVQDVPNAPVLDNVQCNSRDAQVKWHPMGDNRSPILRYTIEYNTSFTPDTWVTAFESVPATDMTYNVFLSPWTNYTFRVKAWNTIGSSLPSSDLNFCTTQPDVPFKNPDKVEGRGTEPNNLVISWTPMPEIEHNAPNFLYRVNWKRDIAGEDWNTDDIYDWKKSELLIRDQPTFQPYRIQVVAMNEKGESNVTPVIVLGYSGEDSPLEAPSNFTLLQVSSSTAALLSWNPVSPESVRGHFKGYKIQTWTDKNRDDNMREIHVKNDATSTLVTKFVPFSKNYARILVYNGRFNGPPSNTLSFVTPEGYPGTIQSLEAYPMGTSALFLVWKRPEQPNGILTGYKIYYQEIYGTGLGSLIEREPHVTDPRQTKVKLAGLKPNTKYRLTVRATTQAGEGEPYFIETRTRSGLAVMPDIPTFKVSQVDSNGYVNMRVTWLPSFEGRPGSHFFVKYRKRGEAMFLKTEPEMNDDSIVIKALEPGEVYEVKVVAVDGEYFVESAPQEINTDIEGPIIQPKQDVATAGWFIGMMLAIAFLLIVLIFVCVFKRNRGGKYDVHDRELANGRRDFPEEGGFHEYSQPLDSKSRHSTSSGIKPGPESDTDSMAEYGEGETAGMNEDGSFIGQYGRKRRPPPGSTQTDSASQAYATLV